MKGHIRTELIRSWLGGCDILAGVRHLAVVFEITGEISDGGTEVLGRAGHPPSPTFFSIAVNRGSERSGAQDGWDFRAHTVLPSRAS